MAPEIKAHENKCMQIKSNLSMMSVNVEDLVCSDGDSVNQVCDLNG